MSSKGRHHDLSGFTLIEILIVTSLLVIIFVSVSSLFLTSLTNGLRTSLWQEVRTEGTFALSQMAYMVRNARSITCPPDTLEIDNFDNTKSQLSVTSGQTLAVSTVPDSASFSAPTAYLTSSDSTVEQTNSANYFTCSLSGEQPYVTIIFTLSRQTESIGTISQQFRRTIFVRNLE